MMTRPGTIVTLAIPQHRQLDRGLLRALIRAAGLSVEDFDEQVKECDAEVLELRAELKEVSTAAAAAKEAWEKQKTALAKKTFDARASPYVE